MHVDGLQGIQVQLDDTRGIIVGLHVLQQHKCPCRTGELRSIDVQYPKPPSDRKACMPLHVQTSPFHL